MPRLIAAALLMLAPLSTAAQTRQMVDPDFKPRVAKPAYPANGPVVAIDEAHRNFHTIGGQYAPFATLLTLDGYRVQPNARPLDAAALKGIDVLVIANARSGPAGGAAFTDTEADAVRDWVKDGGSLLLIADHAPFGTAAASLAARFGVDMGKGYVVMGPPLEPRVTSQILYQSKSLGEHPIVAGRDKDEQLKRVRTFTGQSLNVPAGATALLTIPNGALEVAGTDQVDALREGRAVPGAKVGGRAQAIAMPFGKGRLVVTGEAGMFSAQLIRTPGRPDMRFGMSVAGNDDQQLALNTLHWLTRLL